jgi:uncharacterized protein (TIGR04255 family)
VVRSVTDREIYPNAPLQFVAFELRIPYAPALATLDGTTRVYTALQDIVPIIQSPSMPAGFEVSGGTATPGVTVTSGPTRMVDRGRGLSVIVGPHQLVVETTRYTKFEDFEKVIRRVVETADKEAGPIAGTQRVGLRYIDEIRVDGIDAPSGWEPYIAPALLSGLHLDDNYAPSSSQGAVEFDIRDGQKTVMRFGAMRGFVVDPNGPLRLHRQSDGPFFLLDLDSYWAAAREDEMPEFSPQGVQEMCERLRVPVRALFEASITDKLRNDVLRKEAVEGA